MHEIERKFLVDKTLWKPENDGVSIRQGYLSSDPEKVVRVRLAGEKAFLTIKGRSEGIRRSEFEYDIPLTDAEQLLLMCENIPVVKTRFKEMVGNMVWEIDVFEGENKGLIMAEVELENEDQFVEIPYWIEKEVSNDPRYFNSWLSQNPYSTWDED